jgi:hypothetical protein
MSAEHMIKEKCLFEAELNPKRLKAALNGNFVLGVMHKPLDKMYP